MLGLVDSQHRRFVYLRLSVTDRCNFRCVYCLPNGYQPAQKPEPDLSLDEVRRLVSAFAALGVWKVRVTGGEPTIRRDIVEVAKTIASVPGIQQVAMTTNGFRLLELAAPLKAAGVSVLNVSVDSVDQDRFNKITGSNRLSHVLKGIDAALAIGFEKIKINAVLLKDVNEIDLPNFISMARERPISIRFIELMRTGNNADFFKQNHLSGGAIQLELLKTGWQQMPRASGDGPAVVFRHPDYRGSMGIIAPYSSDFCQTCNRLRVSCKGALRLCLFGERDESLREYLSDDAMQSQLCARIRALVLKEKPASHFLHEEKYGNTWNLAGIGG